MSSVASSQLPRSPLAEPAFATDLRLEHARLPRWFLASVVGISVLPSVLILLGVDLSAVPPLFDPALVSVQGPSGALDTIQRQLGGSFIHTMLEWSAVTVALLTVALVFAHYNVRRELAAPIIGFALFCAGVMDALHVLVASRLIESVADPARLLPLTWTLSRLVNALVLMGGVATLLLVPPRHRRRLPAALLACGAAFTVLAYFAVHWCATSGHLPRMMFPDSIVPRPYDLAPLAFFLVGGVLVLRPFHSRMPGLFSQALLISTIPQVAVQLHAALGSAALYDSNFNAAHFLKIVAYLVPFAGLALEYVRAEQAKAAHESEERYRLVAETATDAIVTIDDGSRIVFANAATERIFGHARGNLLGRPLTMLMPEPLRARHLTGVARYLATGDRHIAWQAYAVEGLHSSGRVIPLEISFGESRIRGLRLFTGILRDVTERRLSEDALKRSEERYALAVRGAKDGLWDWDLETDHVYYSPRWRAMLGDEEDTAIGSPDSWFGRIHPDDATRVKTEIDAHINGLSPQFECEYRMRHSDGEWRWMLTRGLAVIGEDGKPRRMAGSQTDITARRTAEDQLLHTALHDALTGLPNRVLFMQELTLATVRAAEDRDHAFAVLFIDLDRFKVVNDSLGHAAGDQLIIQVAERLRQAGRKDDVVARLGGDEFAYLLSSIRGVADAVEVAERIQASLGADFQLGPHAVGSGASIGIAIGDAVRSPAELLRDADTAMYRAKLNGRGRFELFEHAMHVQAVERLRVEMDLRRALERDELLLYYQPIVSLASGEIEAFEALLRWQHPEKGLLLPHDFLRVAEETGLIIPIGWWVLSESCRRVRAWNELIAGRPPLGIAMNLSSRQFFEPSLVERIDGALRETGLDPRCLRLEMTENVIAETDDSVGARLWRMKALDVGLHIDDFGTGYSSLSYLRRFPIDTVKIDRSFVARMLHDAQTQEIVRTIVELAHHLQMGVIAEGVETEEQLERLRSVKCRHAQGFLFAEPLPASEAQALLVAAPRW